MAEKEYLKGAQLRTIQSERLRYEPPSWKKNYTNASQITSGLHRLKHFFKDSKRKRRDSRSPDPLTTIDELRCGDSVFKEVRNTKKCKYGGNNKRNRYLATYIELKVLSEKNLKNQK